MANVKFLTGTETNLLKKNSDGSYVNPIVEGSLYVTAEKVNGAWVSNLYYDINGQRIKVADTSGKATYDHMNNNIAQTYIKKITMEGTKYASTDGATLTYTTGDNVETTILLPLASTTKAGTVNTGAQTFAGNKTFMGQVILQGGTDTAAGTANSGALIIGSPTGTHISVDANEIQAKSSRTASAQLHINNDGGITQFGGIVQPKADNTLTLGTEKLRWKTIEAVTVNATTFNGALNGNVKGNLDGNASTADKWYTARTITLGEDMQGTVSIDGSKNVTLNAVSYSTSCSSGNKANYPWHRIATTGAVTGSHNDKEMIIAIRHSYDGGGYGVAKIALRTNNVSTGGTASASIRWLYRYNIAKDALKIGLRNTSGNALADLYYKVGTWARCRIYQLQGSRSWTLIASNEVDNTTTTDKLTSKEVYTSVSNGNTILGAGYTTTVEATDGATVQNANYAATADGAKTDSANNTITTHYLSKIGFDGTTNKATKVVVNLYNGSGAIKTTVDFPTASASQAGAITTGTQTLTGAKTLDTNGSLTIQKTSGFNYSGMETASSDSARHVWFSHATNVGTPVKNDKFKLNPGATDTWATVVANATDKTGSAYSKLIVNVVEGIAARAYADDRGQKISTKYVATMAFSGTGSTVTLTYRDGAGANIGTTNIPVASSSAAGIITNAAQSIGGDKTFHGMIKFPNVTTGETKGIQWTMADNDSAKIIAGSTASDSGYLEIQTNDNGNEPIYVRQYSAGTLKRTLTLLNGSGNTIIPGNILPVTHASADTTGQTIGSSSALWKEIYARIFYAYSKFTTPSGLFYANNDGDMYVANNTGLGVAPDSNYALKITGNTFNNGIVYFGNGTTNYVNNSANARFNTVGINGANTTYRLYVNGNTLNNGIVYFANGTTYYINNSADSRLRYVGVGSLAPNSSYALRIGGNVYLNGIHYFANGTTYYVNNSGVAHFKQLLINGGSNAYDFSVSGTGYIASDLTVDGDIITKGNFKNPNGVVSFVQNNTIVNATTDWNTLTIPGCYKVQMSAWGDAATYHSPNSAQSSLYSYGLLFVLKGSTSDSENRTLQIYFPHNTSTTHPNYCRMLNGTTWQAWHKFHRGALDLTGGTMTGTINAQHIYPKTDNTYNNGSSTKRWKEIHGYTIYAHTKFQNPAGSFYADSNGRMYVQNGTGLGVAPSTDGTYILKVTGNSLFNGVLYFANGTNYYINNSAEAKIKGIIGDLYMLTSKASIHWNNGDVQQKIATADDSTANTNVFMFQQSVDTGSTWTDLLKIRDNGVIDLLNNTGQLRKYYSTSNTTPAIMIGSKNLDINAIRIGHTSDGESWSTGYTIKYLGANDGVNNRLELWCDGNGAANNAGTEQIGISVNQGGYVGIGVAAQTAYRLYVNGPSYLNGITNIVNGQEASSATTGTLRVTGGISVSANSWFGGNITVGGYINAALGFGVTQSDGIGKGISLYGTYAGTTPTYGIMFAKTATFGTLGGVTSDWATYFTMSDTNNRGWIFRRKTTGTTAGTHNVFSIDTYGKLYSHWAAAVDVYHRVKNSLRDVGILTAASGNAGLYDYTRAVWLIYTRHSDGQTELYNNTYTKHLYPVAGNTYDIGGSGVAYHYRAMYSRRYNVYDSTGSQVWTSYIQKEGSATEQGNADTVLGNSIASGTVGNSRGRLLIYGTGAYYSLFQTDAASSHKTVTIPNYAGNMVIGNNGYTNPTSATTYYIPFYLNAHKRLSANDGFRYLTLEGTADASGYGRLVLGNNIASGTAKNKRAWIRMYNLNTGYVDITPGTSTATNYTLYLPGATGQLVYHTNDTAIGSSTKPVYVAASGAITVCGNDLSINASSATRLKSLGRNNNLLIPSADAGTSGAAGLVPLTGLAVYEYYAASATGAPTNYGNLLTVRGATSPGATQIALPWGGTTNTAPYIRTHSDWSSDHTWSEWKQLVYTDGTVANATTASKVANALSVNGKSYNGSAAVNVGTMAIAYGGTGATSALNAFYNLNYRGAATNANNNISIGNYYWATDCTNVPIASSYGLLYNFVSSGASHNNSSNWIWQLAFPTSGVDMWLRNKINNSGWSGWVKMLTTGNYTGTLDSRYALISTLQNKGLIKDYGYQSSSSNWSSMLSPNQFTVFTNWWDSAQTYMPYIYGSGLMIPHLDANYRSFLYCQCNAPVAWVGWVNKTNTNVVTWKRLWGQGDSVTGAVWNDYAEFRQSDTQDAGYVLYETGFDDLKKTTERLQHFAGVSSDTWGFSQGETSKAKTPIAVAGRVLVYPYQDKNNYKPGDCVCAAPGGTVDIMTREEVIEYPDRIVGTVSCVPEYETWGGGELADRDPVKVNGRIWIKVK